MYNRKVLYVLTILIMLVCTACGVDDLFDKKESSTVEPSTVMADRTSFYNLGENEGFVVADMFELPDRAKKIDGEWFMSINSVTSINDRFYWNQAEEQMIVTTADSADCYWPDIQSSAVNGETVPLDKTAITLKDGTLYVSVELLQKYTPVSCEIYEDPDRIVLWTDTDEVSSYKVLTPEAPIRVSASLTADILEKAEEGAVIYKTGDETSGFIPVVTADGFCGYIASSDVSDNGTVSFDSGFEAGEYTHNLLEDSYFTAVWHNVAYAADGSVLASELDGSEGVDVVIPTWYRVIDTDGNISSNANSSYVEKAHEMGIEVWGLVDDFAQGVPGIDVLSDTVSRNNLSDSLVASALEYGLDGINIDFEYITYESSTHYIQFLRELYLKMKPYGLRLTVDNYVPNSGNTFYNLQAQEEIVDYIILMTYDEHYSPETGTGSVASIGFVQNGIEGALAYIPAERLVMGVPFYTRLWETDASGQVTMQVLTMKNAMSTAEYYGVTPVWQEESGQYYVSYVDDEGLSCEMWLEETQSVAKKRALCDSFGLAGTASWCLGYELDEVWEELK